MTVAIGYLRVSTEKQADSGLGLAAQRDEIERYAKAKDIAEIRWFQDAGVSGTVPFKDRPGLLAAIRAVPRGGLLIVAKRDRLARDPMVGACCEIELARKKARIVSAGGEGTDMEGPYGKFVRGLIDLVSELERALIAARTKAAKDAAKARGECVTKEPPYGFARVQHGARANGTPIWKLERIGESEVVEVARELRASGLSWPKVAHGLTERGFKPRRAKQWHETQVKRMVKSDGDHKP